MTREEAIARIELAATALVGTMAQIEELSAAEVLQRYIDAYDMAIAALREQPHWVSVEDALPPSEGVPVLAYNRDYCFAYGHMTTAFYKNGHWHGCTGLSMTHWMSLPEPPKEEV